MNKRAIMTAVLAVTVGAGVWFVVTHDFGLDPDEETVVPRPGSTKTVTSSRSASVTETFAGSGSFADLKGMGRNISCKFTFVAETTNAAVAGSLMIAEGQLRSDFEMEQSGGVYKAHLIETGGTTYSWTESDLGTIAVRTTAAQPREEAAVLYAAPFDQEVTYECQPWAADASVFIPPPNLEFKSPEVLGVPENSQ